MIRCIRFAYRILYLGVVPCMLCMLPLGCRHLKAESAGSSYSQSSPQGTGGTRIARQDHGDGLLPSVLTLIKEDTQVPSAVRKRAESALARSALPSEPFLVRAMLYDSPLDKTIILHPVAVDRPADLAGVTIKEERKAADGTVSTITEDYPVYTRYLSAPQEPPQWTWVTIRTESQEKDYGLWEEYLLDTIDWLIYTHIQGHVGNRDHGLTIPPVWISIPEEDVVRVFVAVYDRAGNRSDYVELEDLRGDKYRANTIRYRLAGMMMQ